MVDSYSRPFHGKVVNFYTFSRFGQTFYGEILVLLRVLQLCPYRQCRMSTPESTGRQGEFDSLKGMHAVAPPLIPETQS